MLFFFVGDKIHKYCLQTDTYIVLGANGDVKQTMVKGCHTQESEFFQYRFSALEKFGFLESHDHK